VRECSESPQSAEVVTLVLLRQCVDAALELRKKLRMLGQESVWLHNGKPLHERGVAWNFVVQNRGDWDSVMCGLLLGP
jgi:hypothetical protein